MNRTLSLAFLAVIVVLQSTVMAQARVGPAMPILPVLAVVCWGIHRGPMAAAWWALALGLMLDALSHMPAGFYAVPMLAVASTVALAGRRVFESNLLMPIALAAGASVVYGLVQYAMLAWVTPTELPLSTAALAEATLPLAVLNLLWLPVVYLPLRAAARRAAAPRIGWERS